MLMVLLTQHHHVVYLVARKEAEAAAAAAEAEAKKTCTPEANCQVIAGNSYGGCILDSPNVPGSPGHFDGTGGKAQRMYCVVGTTHASDLDHAYHSDTAAAGGDLYWDSSSCPDKAEYETDDNGLKEQISYDVCDAMLAKTLVIWQPWKPKQLNKRQHVLL